MKLKVKKIKENAVIPTRGSVCAAGYDLYANSCQLRAYDLIGVNPHETVMIGTGIAVEIPDGYFGAIFARSGFAAKKGLRPANCVGVIDSDYRGEVIVALHNDTENVQYFNLGERVAQLVIMPYMDVEIEEAELDETARGADGFGSTGTN